MTGKLDSDFENCRKVYSHCQRPSFGQMTGCDIITATKTGNNHKQPQTTSKQSQTTSKQLQTTSKQLQTTSKQPQTTSNTHKKIN